MTKIYYALIAIFIASSFVACSDDNSDDNTTTPTWDDPSAQYVDYAYYTAKSMGYQGNVKMVERTIFEGSTINLADNKIENIGSGKEIHYFDPNGALVKTIKPVNYSDNNFTDYVETTYIYDSLYREIERIDYYSQNLYYYITKTEYSSKNNTATINYYRSQNGATELNPVSKYVYKLDENGRIGTNDFDYYYPSYDYTKSASQSETPVTSNYTLKVERDSKNNILNTYIIQAYADDKAKASVSNRYEQTITYYDGTVTKPNNILKIEASPVINTTLAKNLGITGNPKNYIRSGYTSTRDKPITMNNSTNTPENGELEYVVKYEFDANGYLNLHDQKIYTDYPVYENNSIVSYKYYTFSSFIRKYEYDTQNRVKTYYNKTTYYRYNYNYQNNSFDYDHPILNTTNTKSVYTYDDVNNIVTEEVYTLDDTDTSVQTESYNSNTEKDAETRTGTFNNTPSSNQKTITKRDNAGNITLNYYITTDYNNSGLINSQNISSYQTSDITYY